MRYLVIGFKDDKSDGEPVPVRPFLRSDNGVVHYAESAEELQDRLENFGDISQYEKVILQEANEHVGEELELEP